MKRQSEFGQTSMPGPSGATTGAHASSASRIPSSSRGKRGSSVLAVGTYGRQAYRISGSRSSLSRPSVASAARNP